MEIQPTEVLRDDLGHWTHPAWPKDGDEDEISKSWFAENGLELAISDFETDASQEISDEYYEDGQPEACAKWDPTQPEGDGWFIFSIHETDDGPICVWVRNIN